MKGVGKQKNYHRPAGDTQGTGMGQNYFGEKIIPNTVQLTDNQKDTIYTVVDDGKCNLILSGSYFTTFQELEFIDL